MGAPLLVAFGRVGAARNELGVAAAELGDKTRQVRIAMVARDLGHDEDDEELALLIGEGFFDQCRLLGLSSLMTW
jgi:hypothetical protein